MQFPIHYQLHVFTKVNYEAQYQTTETEREECDVCVYLMLIDFVLR